MDFLKKMFILKRKTNKMEVNMAANEMLFNLYSKLYSQKSVLTAAPPLSVDILQYTMKSFPVSLIEKEAGAIVSYLCGVPNVDESEVKDIVRIVKETYGNQPFWKDIILDYLEYKLKVQQESIYKKNVELLKETNRVLNEIRQEEHRRKELVRKFGDIIKKEKFHIDCYRLMQTYFTMYRQDAKMAYDTLISNPAYFSPIITVDSEGNQLLTPAEATAENQRIAKFLKTLKI